MTKNERHDALREAGQRIRGKVAAKLQPATRLAVCDDCGMIGVRMIDGVRQPHNARTGQPCAPADEVLIVDLDPVPLPAPAVRKTTRAVVIDPRIPAPGTVVRARHKDREVAVEVTASGFLFEGRTYTSLSTIGTHVAGHKVNGYVFFGLDGKAKRAAVDPVPVVGQHIEAIATLMEARRYDAEALSVMASHAGKLSTLLRAMAKRAAVGVVLLLCALASACTDAAVMIGEASPDMIHAVQPAPADMAHAVDLATASPDLATAPPDLASASADLAQANDLASPPDLAQSIPDMTQPPAPDLAPMCYASRQYCPDPAHVACCDVRQLCWSTPGPIPQKCLSTAGGPCVDGNDCLPGAFLTCSSGTCVQLH